MTATELKVKPWELLTIRLRMAAGWRYRWALGFWLIKAGAKCLAHKVEISIEGSTGDASADEIRIRELEGIVARKTRLIHELTSCILGAGEDKAP